MEDLYFSLDFLLNFLIDAERQLERDRSIKDMEVRYVGVFVFAFKAFYEVDDKVMESVFNEVDRLDEVLNFLLWIWQRDLFRAIK